MVERQRHHRSAANRDKHPGQKGQRPGFIPAQSNALGYGEKLNKGLKARSISPSFAGRFVRAMGRAFSRYDCSAHFPGALPRAGMRPRHRRWVCLHHSEREDSRESSPFEEGAVSARNSPKFNCWHWRRLNREPPRRATPSLFQNRLHRPIDRSRRNKEDTDGCLPVYRSVVRH